MNPAVTLTSVCQPEQGCCSHMFLLAWKGTYFRRSNWTA